MKVYPVIMAGGGGTRFWPLSRRETPKQLLNLSGKNLMVNEAIDRLLNIASHKDIFIVTNKSQVKKMREATSGRVSSDHILSEPAARNTAACIGYAAMEILKKYGDGIMVITPSDAYIKDEEEFSRILLKAVNCAEETDGLVTIGITPTFPATGYGYIKFVKGGGEYDKVSAFKEKPDFATAESYVKSGDYAWNSGMFIWKASVIMEKYKVLLPDIYSELLKIGDAMNTDDEEKVKEEVYPSVRSISVDYGIMEKSNDIFVVSGEFGWNDVGSWDMMGVLHESDEDGNVVTGESEIIDCKDCVVYSSDKLVACMGLRDMVVVQTADAVMVCPKDKVQDVKRIVESLKEKNKEKYL